MRKQFSQIMKVFYKIAISSKWLFFRGPRELARKLKLLAFSQNWEIGPVFTKGCHHGWPQEEKISTTCRTLKKCQPEKEIFQSMTYNTYKSPLRNVFFLCLSQIWLRYGRNRNKQTDWFWLDKVVNKMH